MLKAFKRSFDVPERRRQLDVLKYQEHPKWTSVGCMPLVAALEAESDTMLENLDDILAMSSTHRAVEIMTKTPAPDIHGIPGHGRGGLRGSKGDRKLESG